MPASAPRPSNDLSASRSTAWLMARLAEVPRHGPSRSIAVIVLFVAVIGWIDYTTGPRLSLELFYLIPISLSVAWLGWKVGCITSFMSITIRIVGDLQSGSYAYPVISYWNRLIDLFVYFTIVWVLHALITLQRRLEQRVKERTSELENAAKTRRQLERELLLVGARERSVFGHELHDDICQHLVGTALAAKVLTKHLQATDQQSATKGQAIVDLLEQGAEKTRKLARGLLLSAIEPQKLVETLAEFVEECSCASLPCRFRHEGVVMIADAGIAAQLFRIGQEAVRNALRHSNARQIEVALIGTAECIRLIVEDDGQGIPAGDSSGLGMGLHIMSHRAALINATLTVSPRNGHGTRVVCTLPNTVPSE